MEIIFISGLPCSGKSHLTTRLVERLGDDHAARLPLDHYFLDAIQPGHVDQCSMLVYQRERIDWELLFRHLDQLYRGDAIDTPKYDWEGHKRVAMNSGIGRTRHIKPLPLVFVDGLHPSPDPGHKHVFVNPSWQTRQKLIGIRAGEMNLPDDYEAVLRRVEESPYGEALSWLSNHCWKTVNDPVGLNVRDFCRECGWED